MPKHWHRFANSNRTAKLRDFTLWPDDSAWRRAFLDDERRLLADPEERFDNAAYVELAPQTREVLLWLARNCPRGATTDELHVGLGKSGDQEILNSLWVLRRHLELVEPKGQFQVKGTARWRIIDNNTLFQITVYPELFEGRERPTGRERH